MKPLIALFFISFVGFSTTRNAATCSVADIQTQVNASSNGDTVNVPAGSCTWSTQLTVTSGIILTGQTVCTGAGNPLGVTSGVVTCVDTGGTILTISVDNGMLIGPTTGQLVDISGFTIIANTAVHEVVDLVGNHGEIGFRFHNNHIKMTVSGAQTVYSYSGYGLIDHNFFEDLVSSGVGGIPLDFGGDYSTYGYQNWNDATNLGTNEAIYVEDNYYTTTHQSTEGFFDAYYGAKMVVRYNTIVGNELGGWHGTDSGFSQRSALLGEMYGNSITNVTSTNGVLDTRGGTLLFWNNILLGSSTLNFIPLEYYRYGFNYNYPWGVAGAGLNWVIPDVGNPSDWWNKAMSLNAANYQTSHSYSALAVVGPLTNNAGAFNFQVTNGPCTSGTYPGSWNQTVGGTTTDSGGCIWANVAGTTTVSTLTTAGWCAANPDTYCAADSTCNALSGGDTCSRYLDANGGVYPFRDQPGRIHNQVLAPDYEWGNSGAGLPTTIFTPRTEDSAIIVENRDYYTHNASFDGTSGTGSGLLSSRPSTCTTGVAYWGTNTNILYNCSATNTWSTYYTPYTYPHPLIPVSSGGISISGKITIGGKITIQ